MNIVTRANKMESLRVPGNDERRARWAAQYYRLGAHRRVASRVKTPGPGLRRDDEQGRMPPQALPA